MGKIKEHLESQKLHTKKEFKELVKKSGLNIIDDTYYTLRKVKAKRPSAKGYPDSDWTVIERASVEIICNQGYVWLYFNSPNAWFRTSPVLSTIQEGKNYVIETENSIYLLERV